MSSETRAVEFHDSEVTGIRLDNRDVVVEIIAYVHASQGRPGIDRGTGWSQRAELIVEDATVERSLDSNYLWITDGFLEVNSKRFNNLLPVPFGESGKINLKLSGAEGSLWLSGRRVRLLLTGTPTYVEDFPGAEKQD